MEYWLIFATSFHLIIEMRTVIAPDEQFIV